MPAMQDKMSSNAKADVVKISNHLKVELLDPERLVKVNNLKEISNPLTFSKNAIPTPDGLLSYDIFGITKDERANTYAYIDLHEYFLNPLVYKVWGKMDSNIRDCIHGTKTFIIDSKGHLKEDPDGDNGIEFLRKNIKNIKITRTSSTKRDMNVDFIEKSMKTDAFFIRKYIVIPAYYRDVNTENGRVSIGELNELYRLLIIAVKALKESSDYGLTLSAATRGRIQEILTQIYAWFGQGTVIGGKETSNNIPGKTGVIRRSINAKTTDYSSRLVIGAPDLKAEKLEDVETTMRYSCVPLSSICTNFYPFIVFWVRRFFENEFSGDVSYPMIDKTGKLKTVHPKDYQYEFSDEKIGKEIDRFIKGYSNRFIPITVKTEEGSTFKMRFKGYNLSPEEYAKGTTGQMPLLERDLTWCDIFYRAAVDVVKDKHILITRYPIDSCYNQFPTKIRVSSTKDTEPMIIGNTSYRSYPKIRQQDIGSNTSNKFVDILNISNTWLDSIGGDYDGDQVTVKGIYSTEANQELDKFINSKAHLVNFGANSIPISSNEAIQTLYNLTLALPEDKSKLQMPEF